MKLSPKAWDALLLYFLAAASWAVTPSYGGDPVLCPTYIAFSVDASPSISPEYVFKAWSMINTSISGAVDQNGLLHLAALKFYSYSPCQSTVVVPGWSTQQAALTALTPLPSYRGDIPLGCIGCAVEEAFKKFLHCFSLE